MSEHAETQKMYNEFMSDRVVLAEKIKVGDVVRLNSGGREMTAMVLFDDDEPLPSFPGPGVHCVWFDGDGQLQRDDFPLACIKRQVLDTSEQPY